MKRERLKNFFISLSALLALWLVWVIAFFVVRNDFVLPSFWETFRAMGEVLGEGVFWRALGNTFLRTLYSFLFSLVAGVGLAALATVFKPLRAFFAPVVSVLRTVPTMAVILVLLLWTSPAAAPVAVSALVLMPAVYAAALAAFTEVEEEYGELARVFHVSRARRVFKMYLPVAAPPFFKQAGAIFSMGLKVTVSGEVLSSTFRSMGGMMQEAQIYLDTPRLLALTLLAVLLGFAIEGACALVYSLVARWRR